MKTVTDIPVKRPIVLLVAVVVFRTGSMISNEFYCRVKLSLFPFTFILFSSASTFSRIYSETGIGNGVLN